MVTTTPNLPIDRLELTSLAQRLRAVTASMGATIAALDRLADSVEADRGEVEAILERRWAPAPCR